MHKDNMQYYVRLLAPEDGSMLVADSDEFRFREIFFS
jgi:hypothetical protein